MIEHTVSFRLHHDAGSDAETAFLDAGRSTLAGILGVQEFRVARQVSGQSDLQWQFSMIFASQAEYTAYNEHPEHRAFVETRWVTEVAAFQELDFVPVDGAE
jgi:hypothetical protein